MSIRKRIQELLVENRKRTELKRKSALEVEFERIGYFITERADTIQDNFVCTFVPTAVGPSDAFIYLLIVDGAVKYVGETRNGVTRFSAYRYDTGNGQGKRISDLIFDALLASSSVEVYVKEAPSDDADRRVKETHFIELFDTKRSGWNFR